MKNAKKIPYDMFSQVAYVPNEAPHFGVFIIGNGLKKPGYSVITLDDNFFTQATSKQWESERLLAVKWADENI